MKKLIFVVFPLVLMLTGCPFFCQFGDEIEIENVDLSITPMVIPKDDVYTYVLEENINLNLTFKPDFEKFEKYRLILFFSEYEDNETDFYGEYFSVDDSIVKNNRRFYFDETDYKDEKEIIQSYKITPIKAGKYDISIQFDGYAKDEKDHNTYRNERYYIWNIREP